LTAGSAPLAIALGDPAGIGPEVILGAWTRLRTERRAPPAFVVGGPNVLRNAAEALGIDPNDFVMRRQLAGRMGAMGWATATVRRNGNVVRVWRLDLSRQEG
jgi:4-hydroxy-L-threonine phosphate dehydrogenase PdxA